MHKDISVGNKLENSSENSCYREDKGYFEDFIKVNCRMNSFYSENPVELVDLNVYVVVTFMQLLEIK